MENPIYNISLYSHLPAFIALVFAILLLTKREKYGFSAKIMGVIMLLWMILTGSYLINPGDYVLLYKGDIIYNSLALAVVSLHAVYFSYLTQNKLRLRTAVYLFAPAVIATLALIIAYTLAGEENSVLYIRNYLLDAQLPTPSEWRYRILTITYAFVNPLIVLQSAAVMIYIYRLLKKYDLRLSDYYSNIDDKNKPANYFVFYITLTLLAFSTLYTIIVEIDSSMEKLMLNTGLVVSSIIFFLMGRSVLYNHFSAADMDYELSKAKTDESIDESGKNESIAKGANKNGKVQNNINTLDKKLHDLIIDKKLYLQEDLTLDDLAAQLGTNRTYLSQLFNQVYGVSFYDYINSLRIKHAEALLADPKKGLLLEHIATESGFTAASSFYRIFKQTHGCTPTQWRKKFTE